MLLNRLNSLGKHLVSQRRFKSRINRENYPVLNPEDLEEKFTLGSGPGGLADNRTPNAMPSSSNISQLVSGSSGQVSSDKINRVKQENSQTAFIGKLDNHLNGENSV